MIETLMTRRLVLRPVEERDAARIQSLCADLAVTRWLARVLHPYPDGEAARFITLSRERRHKNWAIELTRADWKAAHLATIGGGRDA
ncbi:MAG: GNAT family N-acetyltransferase [Pseudomonadota bacterium]